MDGLSKDDVSSYTYCQMYYRAPLIWQVYNDKNNTNKMICFYTKFLLLLIYKGNLIIKTKRYSLWKCYRTDALQLKRNIKIELDESFEKYNGFYPEIYTICRVGDNLVKVTPIDYLNKILNARPVMNNNLPEPVKKVMELIHATQKTVKEFSTTEPTFYADQLCKYSFTLEGQTIEEIFHQINRMYFNIINQTSMDYSTLRKLYSDIK